MINTKFEIKKELALFNWLQYLIGFILVVLFLLSFIPGEIYNFYVYMVGLLISQMILSIVRLRILNAFLEIFILALSFLSLIPILGYFFRFLGLLFAIFDLSTFNSFVYQKIKVVNVGGFGTKEKKPKPTKKVKKKPDAVDAEFKEKE